MPEIAVVARLLAEVPMDSVSTLTAPELNRAQTLMDGQARRDFLAGRLAVRRELAACLGLPEQELAADFDCPGCLKGNDGGHGRPRYRHQGEVVPASVSFSRSGGWLLLAVSDPGLGLGVDVEDSASAAFADGTAIDTVMLTEAEAAEVRRRRRRGARARLRAEFWSRKEAVLKATGTGLRTDPSGVGTGTAGRAELTAWPAEAAHPGQVRLGGLPAHTLGLPPSFAASWAVVGAPDGGQDTCAVSVTYR